MEKQNRVWRRKRRFVEAQEDLEKQKKMWGRIGRFREAKDDWEKKKEGWRSKRCYLLRRSRLGHLPIVPLKIYLLSATAMMLSLPLTF